VAEKNELDPVAVEVGRRIDEAWARAGFGSRAAMVRASGLPDYNQVARWCQGKALPALMSIAAIAKACEVSLDWLVFGADGTPATFMAWLETPAGISAPDEARRFLRSMPLHGYRASLAFYDLAYQAWTHGLHQELGADETVRAVRETGKRR
jgi:hypothetical protein